MANLAIKGHATRGSEVIELLEMLGGINKYKITAIRETYVYFVDEDKIIRLLKINQLLPEEFIILTLEEFLEKFPYKVGDKVSSKYIKNCKIVKMEWEDINSRVIYKLQGFGWYAANELQLYEEENMEETKEDLCLYDKLDFEQEPCADKVELVLGDNYEIKKEDGKTYVVRKKPQYPDTYEECCEVLDYEPEEDTVRGYNSDLIEDFQKLKLCRDAYWKIAGNWKPDWKNGLNKCCITVCENRIIKSYLASANAILAFPTEEIRDAFYENFKDLIENCKEIL